MTHLWCCGEKTRYTGCGPAPRSIQRHLCIILIFTLLNVFTIKMIHMSKWQ